MCRSIHHTDLGHIPAKRQLRECDNEGILTANVTTFALLDVHQIGEFAAKVPAGFREVHVTEVLCRISRRPPRHNCNLSRRVDAAYEPSQIKSIAVARHVDVSDNKIESLSGLDDCYTFIGGRDFRDRPAELAQFLCNNEANERFVLSEEHLYLGHSGSPSKRKLITILSSGERRSYTVAKQAALACGHMTDENPRLGDLRLSAAAISALAKLGYNRLDDLRLLSNAQILSIPNVGGASFKRILKALGRDTRVGWRTWREINEKIEDI